MNKSSCIAMALAASAFVAVSANAQTYSDVTKHTGFFGNRAATISSLTTPAYDAVQDTRAGLTVIASATAPNISATLTFATKDDSIVSESAIILNQTTPTVVQVSGPINFQKVRLRLNAPGNATAKVNIVQSR